MDFLGPKDDLSEATPTIFKLGCTMGVLAFVVNFVFWGGLIALTIWLLHLAGAF